MALSENPNLALIPSGYKAGKIYSVLPTNGVGDFNFARGTIATRINSSGLIEEVASNVPRLNYPMIDGVVKGCPSLLLEPQRTQRIQYSEDFSYWTIGGSVTVTDNQAISPDGTLNATLIYPLSNSSNVGLYTSSSSSTIGTVSCFVKSSGKDFALLGTDNNANYYCVFDLANETVVYEATNYEGKIEKYPNGWYRISSTYVSSTAQGFPFIGVADNSGGTVIADSDNGILIFGMQYEHEAFKTSYIPNYGTASGVTRSAETANGSGSAATFNSEQGVLMAEISALDNDGSNRSIAVINNNSNRISFRYDNSANRIEFYCIATTQQYGYSHTLSDIKEVLKVAFLYSNNNFQVWINGIKVDFQNSGSTPIDLSSLDFNLDGGANDFYGNVKQIQYFDTTDIDLEQLTSWVSFQEMAEGQLYTIE
uniref:Uncharacterized protein n=1 Tax=uncultured marine virus TaxID=186617 RepID=A0A0F7L6D4_9VIRU|nr:hypothetical protein P12024S_10 [uncultured marine virus]